MALSHRSLGRGAGGGVGKHSVAHCSWGSFPPTSLCQSSSPPSSSDFGSSHMSGHTPTPPWCTPRLNPRTSSRRNKVTCAWCSCWELGGFPILAPLPKNPKAHCFHQCSCSTNYPNPQGFIQYQEQPPRATLTPPSPSPITCELAPTLHPRLPASSNHPPPLHSHPHLLASLPTPEGCCQKPHLNTAPPV